MHILCTICSDLVNPAENIYSTKCGHIFHHNCLIQWIERSQSCPQCRNKVTRKCMFRIYPTVSNEVSVDDAATLQSKLDNTQLQLRQSVAECKEKEEKLAATVADLKKQEENVKAIEKKLLSQYSAVTALKEQLEYVKIQNRETQKLREENETLKKNMQTLTGLQKVLNATSDDVEQMLQGYTDVRTIATFATALKRALCESEAKKNECRDKLTAVKQQLAMEKKNCADLEAKFKQIEKSLLTAQRNYEAFKLKRKASQSSASESLESSVKVARLSDVEPMETFETPVQDMSINSMVRRIENADSPYLNLKQSNLALATLQRPTTIDSKLKPSEFGILKSVNVTATRKIGTENRPSNSQGKPSTSIFHKKDIAMDFENRLSQKTDLDISYDGLGGHSKLDLFPKPNLVKPKSSVPKITFRHRLKRPETKDNHDIGAMLEKLRNK